MIYLHTSAIVKLVRLEPESAALTTWLNERSRENKVTSRLAEVELPRTLAGTERTAIAEILARLDRFEINDEVRGVAAGYPQPRLSALDAIHLATADHLVALGKTLSAFISYDATLRIIAEEISLTTAASGQT
jgi:predicted nucleic acid-binding protein